MTTKQVYETIEKAIIEKTELNLTVKHGLGSIIEDTLFQAYIIGDDTYQYAFVWGYLPSLGLYYKFMLDNITSAKLTSQKYDVRDDACYQHCIEEEHFGFLEGFKNAYQKAARHESQRGKL